MNNKKSTGLCFLAFFVLFNAPSEVLTWQANAGQQYGTRITVKESVTGLESITAKPAVITETALYQEAAAKRQSTIPYLQGIPAFPKTDLVPGAVWSTKATVSYDLSAFGFAEPVVIEVPVSYILKEITDIDSRSFYHILAEWAPIFIPTKEITKKTGIVRISGLSSMDLYWDNKSGAPKRSTLTEEIQYRFAEKTSLLVKRETGEEFKTVTDLERELVVRDLNQQIVTQKVANVEVKQSDAGVVLSVDNIQFDAESTKLADSEKAKLTKIGNLLSSLQDRWLSVVGHAANPAGSDPAELLTLSAARAQAVADFLVQSGIRTADSVVASGMGGTKPLATNETAEGRTKNRRVEIVIIDKEETK